MAVGTQYDVAENGWVRFEENNPNFNYTKTWANWSGELTSGGTDKRTSTIGQTIRFKFTGTGIRVISPKNYDLANSIRIFIDGVEEFFSEYSPTLMWRVCVYEKTGLENKTHDVQIVTNTTSVNIFDAVDLIAGNTILPSPIGKILTSPESGWKRIEETDASFTYEGTWGSRSAGAYSGGTQKTQANTVLGNKIKFKFYGTKIRIISTFYPSYTPKARIIINGKAEYFSLLGDDNSNMSIVYEKSNLPLGLHYVEVEKVVNGGYNPDFMWDAIDIDSTGYIADINYSFNRLAIKCPKTDEHYSLSDSTLIHMPDNSAKNMILHGIEQGKEIQLDVPFDKHRYFNDTPVANVSGKVFTHDIGIINTLNIKEVR
ncbi:hypothetical protein [Lysinibacillus sphaericus]|uniref:hypothetical protein n=1 Tax=Lysinibacillus sphaericus TaxID=1421 RepID=UPI001CC1002B|nr:hypothetical protein [Lysinibacillus sphaericus]